MRYLKKIEPEVQVETKGFGGIADSGRKADAQ